MTEPERVAVVAGARTPFARAGGALKDRSALDLAIHSVEGLLATSGISPDIVDEMGYGIVTLAPRMPQFAREVNLRSSLPATVRSYTVVDNCITGITAISQVADSIRAGRASVGIAGGVDSMSNPAVLFSARAARAFSDATFAKTASRRLRALARLRPTDFKPRPPGIKEPSTGLSMGEHTEITVKEWGISRVEQDEIAYRSHVRAAAATESGVLGEDIYPIGDLATDTIIRSTTSMEKLAKLAPVFDRSVEGTLTAGNSSPLTDGASAVLLMSESAAGEHGLEPLAFVRGVEFAAIDPDDGLLMAPGLTVPRLLQREGLELSDFDIIDIHEAFGGQVAANIAAWERGWKERPIGKVDPEILNVNGGSIAIGHPFAATGGRVVTQSARELARRGGRLSLVSVCGAGATGAAMVLERP